MPSLFWIVAVANVAPFALLSFNPFDLNTYLKNKTIRAEIK